MQATVCVHVAIVKVFSHRFPPYFCANCVVLLHSIYRCIHFPAGPSNGKGQKIQLSTYSMQTNMFHRQVQQQEPYGFVSDTFDVSGAPGGAKDRSALSVTSCCLLTFAHAHYYTVVVAASSRATCVLCLGNFSAFLQDSAPKVHCSSP